MENTRFFLTKANDIVTQSDLDQSLYLMTGRHFTENMSLIDESGKCIFENIVTEIFIDDLNIQELISYFYSRMTEEEFIKLLFTLYKFPKNIDNRLYNRLFKMLRDIIKVINSSIDDGSLNTSEMALNVLRQVLDIEDIITKIMNSDRKTHMDPPYTQVMFQEHEKDIINFITNLSVVRDEFNNEKYQNNIIHLHNGVVIYYRIGYEMDISRGVRIDAFLHSDNELINDFSIENYFDLSVYEFALLIMSSSMKPMYYYINLNIRELDKESSNLVKIYTSPYSFKNSELFDLPIPLNVVKWMIEFLNLDYDI